MTNETQILEPLSAICQDRGWKLRSSNDNRGIMWAAEIVVTDQDGTALTRAWGNSTEEADALLEAVGDAVKQLQR